MAWHTPAMLRPYQEGDLAAIVELQHRWAPAHRRWSREEASEQLTDTAREHGDNTLVALRHGVIVGAIGWVELGISAGEFYGAPFLARDDATADLLLEQLLARARQLGAAWIRVSIWPGEESKRRAVERAGFVWVRDFIDFELALGQGDETSAQLSEFGDLHPVNVTAVAESSSHESTDAIDPQRFADLYNECFRDVDNSPETTVDIARETWESELTWPEASALLADETGRYQAFSIVHKSGDLDTVGVTAAWRKRGLARAMIDHAKRHARKAGLTRLLSSCSSHNEQSLALHAALGFIELGRLQVWQLDF